MQSSSQPPKPRRFDTTKRPGPKSHTAPAPPKEDKNMNTIPNPSARRAAKTPVASPRTRLGAQPRAPLYQPKVSAPRTAPSAAFRPVKPKAKSTRVAAANRLSPSPAPPAVPSLLPLLDPNCNEPSLPCLCCDGRSPQDNNSMFNHNHNNNNTISLRQQMQLPAPPGPLFQKQEEMRALQEEQPRLAAKEPQIDRHEGSAAANVENKCNNNNEADIPNNPIKVDEEEDDDSSGDIDIEEDRDDEDEDTDDDTLVPSCCDCPPSLLDFSLSSSTSSSSTSISSCSDLDSDSADQSYSMSSSNDQDNLSFMLSPKVCSPLKAPESKPPARSPPSLPLSHNPFYLSSHSPSSPDEGYPSALDSPDYLGIKEDSEMSKLSLLDFLESVGEFGKMERFSQVIQVARWDLEGEQHWDVLRDRIDHLDRLEKVNREVKLAYIARLHEKGFDLSDLEEQNLSDIMDEMGNIDIPWKLYRNHKCKMQDSQEFSDAGVDLTAPSDCEDPLAPDSLTPSPIEAPPKPPVRHASVTSDLHTYINISREPSSVVPTSPTPLSTFSLHTTSPTFTTFRCEKSTPVSPPSIPPLPASKPVPYLTLYTAPSPTIPTPTPPIPPPRTRHLARKEAQRRAALLAEQEKSPTSLPPPTTRPPPLPPPPVISISSSSPPAIPPPPALPPPPSFHALDVEIRKLLMLAGLTQAELLKLSPELGVCVGGLEDEEDTENIVSSCDYTIGSRGLEKDGDKGLVNGLYYRDILDEEAEESKEERRETQRTTSFSEMARRRRKNAAYYMSEPYYSTGLSNTSDSKEDNIEMYRYASHVPSSPPPPPPPRPLPPIPSCAPQKVSTLPANSAQPERFDWLIAFTPDSESLPKIPHFEMRKRAVETPKKSTSSSGSAPKVTTFKELRNRKSSSPPTKVITAPEPDPNIITPDPDLLYNLKWRRDKAGGDGSQWEYTSQAQALFMQPPPALTSMAALKEMLQRAEEEAAKSELCPPQKLGYSVSDGSLWNLSGTEWAHEEVKMEEKKDEGETAEMRGQADGERSTELRTSASSLPPPPLAQSSLPYFLHSADQRPCPNFGNPFLDPRPHNPVGRKDSEKLQIGPWDDADGAACVYGEESSIDKLFESLDDFGIDSICDYRDYEQENTDIHASTGPSSMCHFDSLCCSESSPAGTTCPTPYKNIDAIMRYNNSSESVKPSQIPHRRVAKELPPLPTFYLYHPKNCPLHRGAPPRLSPIGALSPPQRAGPPPGAPQSGLSSPLFPRSHTLPALAAPLYYPNLYPPVPPRAPLLPPKKLYQEQSHVATVRSVSFAGSVHRGETWMAEDVRRPVRGLGLPPLCLQEKRALVSAVSVAVEAILAQFSTSRTIVQKALSGDSTVNPSLGRLVLQCLCPALHSLLTDGLKPHQSDLIAGRRPNSAWSLVQASTRPGTKTQALFNLQSRVGELPQLKQSKHRFNAFILGLLNIKHLDFWLSHLHTCSDVLETYYHPSSFMRVSLSVCRPQFDELLLVLQPLSLLTFNLDLLFQHHHWDPHSPKIPKTPVCQDAALPVSDQACPSKKSEEKYMESLTEEDIQSGEVSKEPTSLPKTDSSQTESKEEDLLETSPQLRWVKETEFSSLPPPDLEEDSFAQQAGQVIQQGWEVMMRWGGRLSQNLSELSVAAMKKDELKTEDLQAHSDFVPVSSGAQIPWGLDRLFGAPKSLSSPNSHPAPTRRPSQWLAPSVSVLTRKVSSSTAPYLKRVPEASAETAPAPPEKEAQAPEMNDQPRPLRSVRTLCDHRGSGSELSFCKGEELQVLGGVDQDWIRCRRGDTEGLVPIGYTSLIM